MLDYETLKLIWWVFMGLLLIGFILTDGFDLGMGILLPFVGKTDPERRVMLNSVGPVWDGNQVWLILAGGAIFAAWPVVYATAFSGFYFAMLLVLFPLILRPGAFDYRSKEQDPRWRSFWDWALFTAGAVPSLVFGVAFGNLLLGVPFHFDENLRSFYTGSFWGLLNPYALLAGVVSVAMITTHGATFLQLRTEGEIAERSRRMARLFSLIYAAAFALAGLWLALGLDGYKIVAMPDPGENFHAVAKTVVETGGGWLGNYGTYPWMMLAPLSGFLGAAAAWWFSRQHHALLAFLGSSLMIIGTILTAGFSLFPFIMPSSLEPAHSLTIWDATSSHLTLNIMFWVTVFFLPLILAYTTWVYSKVSGKVTLEQIEANTHSVY